MLSALIPPVGRKPAVPLAGQLAHESCVRPGPLVLGTAFLRSPTAASDRDRTVSRMNSRITTGIDYTFTLFLGAGVLWLPRGSAGFSAYRSHLFAVAGEEVVTGAQHALATQMLLDIYGGYPLRLRIV